MRSTTRLAVVLCVIALVCLSACSGAPTPSPAPRPTPTTVAPARPHVVILSLDGAGDDRVDGYLEEGTMPNLASLAQRGARAEYAQTIDPSLSAATHVSMATGAYPGSTGQVSDRFHLSKDAFYWGTNGFEEPQMQVEPLWRTAMRNGLTTATVFWPGTRTRMRDLLADYALSYGAGQVPSALHVITPTEASDWQDAPSSYSPLLAATLIIGGKDVELGTKLYLLGADGTDDQEENYDTFFLCGEKRVDDDSVSLDIGELTPFPVRSGWHAVGYFKLLGATSERIEVFQSALRHAEARPVELFWEIDDKFGFLPAPPDSSALERGWITAQDYWEMAKRHTQWLAQVLTYVFTTYQPDLTFAWLGVIHECSQQFLMVDEQQPDYSEEMAQAFAEYVRAAYALADESLGNLLNILLLGKDTVFVVSDHGMAPNHSEVNVNTLLEQAALLQHDEASDSAVEMAQSKALGFARGAAVHVYINLEGREQPGIVPIEDYGSVQDDIMDALQSASDTDGKPVFARVLRRKELSALHLDSPNSGDVFAQASLGFMLTDRLGNQNALQPAPYYGQDGYDSTWPEMHAILIAAGYGIRPGVHLQAVHLLDIVPTAASLLRVKPVEAAQGRVLEEMLQDRP